MIIVIVSTSDPASVKIGKYLKGSDVSIDYTSDSLNYNCKKCDLLIFVSKHESSKGVNSLTCHTPGNYGTALYGGESGKLSISDARIQTSCLKKLKELNLRNSWELDVCFEVTHHGPSLSVPCLFVEIGSSAEQWNNERYCSGIASVVKELIQEYRVIKNSSVPSAVGIGGSHYAHSFTSLIFKENVCFGHICPNYALESLNKSVLKQMINKTVPEPSTVFIDKKVKSELRNKIIEWCGELSIKCVRLK